MTPEDIFREVEVWSGRAVTFPLRVLLSRTDGTSVCEFVRLYAPDEILERNQTYETGKYCPGWLTIGDDGGGRAIVVAPDKWPTPVYMVDHGSMSRADFVELAQDLHDWVNLGCKL